MCSILWDILVEIKYSAAHVTTVLESEQSGIQLLAICLLILVVLCFFPGSAGVAGHWSKTF